MLSYMKNIIRILKDIFSKGSCKECGYFIACDTCSEKYDKIDSELDR